MKRKLAVALFLLSLTTFAQKEVELNEQGIEYAKKGDLEKAFDLFNKAIETNPKYPNGFSNRGQVYRQMKKYDLAIIDFTKSLELNADNPNIISARADAYMSVNNFEKATTDYTTIINKNPSYKDIYFDRGYSYIMQKKYEEAKKDMEQQLVLNPNDFKSLANLINLKKHLKMNTEALADYESLIKNFPNQPNMHIVYNNRANLYQDLNELDKALADINKALEIKPDYDMGYLNRAEIYNKMGEKKLACEDFSRAKQLKVESNKYFEADKDYLSVKKLCE